MIIFSYGFPLFMFGLIICGIVYLGIKEANKEMRRKAIAMREKAQNRETLGPRKIESSAR